MSGKRVRIDYWRAFHGLPFQDRWKTIGDAAGLPASAVFHVALCLLDTASRARPRGVLGVVPTDAIVTATGLTHAGVVAVASALRDAGFYGGDGPIPDWAVQPKREDRGAAGRKRRQRERDAAPLVSVPDQPPQRAAVEPSAMSAGVGVRFRPGADA
jgi:hypothetical protein